MKKFLILFLFFVTLAFNAFAEDLEGSKDYPMFTRMPNFEIIEFSNNFDTVEFQVTEEKTQKKEGDRTFIKYNFNSETVKYPSSLQIIRNYQNAVKKLGGVTVYENDNSVTFKINKGNKEIWIMLNDFYRISENGISAYDMNIIEIEAMKQEVAANEIFDALSKDGFIALYINFDTGKAIIKAESQPLIDQIAEMLKANPDLKVSIEGHTDNVGTAQSNKTLSVNRAKAVMDALISKGISADKLSSAGWGQEKPIADNRTEDGKAKNRRVEIVKK